MVLLAVVEKCSQDFYNEYGYKKLSDLGRGKMGHVLLAHNPNDRSGKTLVAVKSFSKGAQDRNGFLREVAILQKIQHKHIMGNIRAYESPSEYTVCMPYYQRGSLMDLLMETKLTVLITDIYLIELASAIRYLHAHQIVHRDIKPPNILLSDKGNLVLSDFGLACVVDAKSRSCHRSCGTPGYMAPELAGPMHRHIDLYKCDMYSLGVILCNMIFGGIAVPAGMDLRTILRTQPYIPAFYKNVGEHLLHKDPNARWDSQKLMSTLSSWPPMADLLHD